VRARVLYSWKPSTDPLTLNADGSPPPLPPPWRSTARTRVRFSQIFHLPLICAPGNHGNGWLLEQACGIRPSVYSPFFHLPALRQPLSSTRRFSTSRPSTNPYRPLIILPPWWSGRRGGRWKGNPPPLPDHRFYSLPSSRRSNPHLSPPAPFNTIFYPPPRSTYYMLYFTRRIYIYPYTYTYTHKYIYICVYVYVCVCVRVLLYLHVSRNNIIFKSGKIGFICDNNNIRRMYVF